MRESGRGGSFFLAQATRPSVVPTNARLDTLLSERKGADSLPNIGARAFRNSVIQRPHRFACPSGSTALSRQATACSMVIWTTPLRRGRAFCLGVPCSYMLGTPRCEMLTTETATSCAGAEHLTLRRAVPWSFRRRHWRRARPTSVAESSAGSRSTSWQSQGRRRATELRQRADPR